MIGIQIVGILFVLFMLYITFLHRKKKVFTIKESVLWVLLWIVFLLITIFPTSLNFFVKDVLQMQRPLDFYIILGFMFLIGALFHTYTQLRKYQKKLDELVSKIAIDNAEKE